MSRTHEASQLRVIVVDDEPLIRMSTAEILRDAGFDVVEACNAEEGLLHVGDGQPIFAIVTDVEMPGPIDGYGLAWRAHLTRPDTALFVISGRVQPSASELPPNARFLSKPLAAATLLSELRRAVDATESEAL